MTTERFAVLGKTILDSRGDVASLTQAMQPLSDEELRVFSCFVQLIESRVWCETRRREQAQVDESKTVMVSI